MPLTDEKKDDLARVLAAVVKGMDGNVEAARRVIDQPGRRRKALEFTKQTCGHELRIPVDSIWQVGGGGVVIQCEEVSAPAVKYAFKVARPSLFTPDQAAIEVEKARREQRIHLPLVHENIAKLYGMDEISVADGAAARLLLPCTLIEWVNGAQALDDYLATEVKDPRQLAQLLAQACAALDHLHAADTVHWDIKGDNVLVSEAGAVKLMDLGNARRLRAATDTYEEDQDAESSYLNLPPTLHRRVEATRAIATDDDPRISLNRSPCVLKAGEPSWDRPWLDLYMLAREVNSLFAFDQHTIELDKELAVQRNHEPSPPDATGDDDATYVLQYLQQIVRRMLAADSPDADAFYSSAEEVAAALERLWPEYGGATAVPELHPVPQHVLRLPPKDNAPWTERVSSLMNSEPLLRLKQHRQLATVHHVFPGAEHTRWEHAVGAFAQMLQRVRSLYADRSSVAFRLDTTELDVTALMLATLLHDLGHPAFGHQLEESPLVSLELHHEAHSLDVLRQARIASSDSPTPHSVEISDIRSVLDAYWDSANVPVDAVLDRAIEILECAAGTRPPAAAESPAQQQRRIHTELLTSLISGQLDADKADYLVRDAHHCGVEYPNGIDQHRLDQALTSLVVRNPNDPPFGTIGITEKGILPLESMLIARYQMFRAVYWQHTVRALTVMLQEAVERYAMPTAAASSTAVRQRMTDLVHEFRARSDEDAIQWLIKQDERSRYTDLCEGVLGDRKLIFWHVFAIHGDTPPEAKQTDSDEALYRRIRASWASDRQDGLTSIRARRDIRRKIAQALSEKARAAGKSSARGIKESDLLLDIPVLGSDDVRQLFVAVGAGPARTTIPLERRTPLARAVIEAFEASVRPARVFVRPSIGQRLVDAGDYDWFKEELREAVELVLTDQLRFA